MFAKWFGTRSPRRSVAQEHRFRPQLECLEGRLAPSSMGMGGNDNAGGNGNGNDHDTAHINIHDNYHINLHDNVSVVIDTITVNQTLSTLGTPIAQLEQQFFSALSQALTTTPGASIGDAVTLVTEEFELGTDIGMLVNGILSGAGTNTGLLSTISSLETAIQNNLLQTSASGQVAGNLAFNIALQLSLPQLTGQQGHS